jgi:hypothetical protein
MRYLFICLFFLSFSFCKKDNVVEYFCSEKVRKKVTKLENIVEFDSIKTKIVCNYSERFFYAYINENIEQDYDTIAFIESPKPYIPKNEKSESFLGFKKYSDLYVFYFSDKEECKSINEIKKTLATLNFKEDINSCKDIINSSLYVYDKNYNIIEVIRH